MNRTNLQYVRILHKKYHAQRTRVCLAGSRTCQNKKHLDLAIHQTFLWGRYTAKCIFLSVLEICLVIFRCLMKLGGKHSEKRKMVLKCIYKVLSYDTPLVICVDLNDYFLILFWNPVSWYPLDRFGSYTSKLLKYNMSTFQIPWRSNQPIESYARTNMHTNIHSQIATEIFARSNTQKHSCCIVSHLAVFVYRCSDMVRYNG